MRWALIDQVQEDQETIVQRLLEWEGRLARAFELFGEWYDPMHRLKIEALALQRRARSEEGIQSQAPLR